MKTLLLLLLPFVGMCQTAQSKVPPKDPTEYTMLAIRLSTLFYTYKRECYADSSLHFSSQEDIFYINTNDKRGLSERMKPFWVHRKPTFEGFMEYVDKISK